MTHNRIIEFMTKTPTRTRTLAAVFLLFFPVFLVWAVLGVAAREGLFKMVRPAITGAAKSFVAGRVIVA